MSLSSNLLQGLLLASLILWSHADNTDTEVSEPARVSTKPVQEVTPKAVTEPVKDKHGIWELNDDLFDSFLDSHSDVAILFSDDSLFSYAGKYHFDRAAHILRDLRNSTTEFAVFEGGYNDDSAVHKEMNFEFYPQIKYCHHDHLSPQISNDSSAERPEWEIRCLDYNHHIIELQVVQWVEGLNSQCSVLIENEEQFESAKSEHDVLFIGYFESLDSVEFDLFDDICKQYRWEKDIWAYEPRFAVILEPELRAKLSGRTPGMTVYCAFKENAWIFQGPMRDRSAMKSFIETERYPYFTQISAFNFKQYTQDLELPLLWVAIDDEHEQYVERVGRFYEQMGIDYKGYLAIIWVSSNKFMGHIRKLGFPFVPGVMFIDKTNNYKQLYDPDAHILDEDGIRKFIDSALDGSGTLFIKSQDDEELQMAIDNDLKESGKENILVQHVNGRQLHEMLEGDEAQYGDKNVFVFYYAPWDSRSQDFHPIWEHVAELLTVEDGTAMYNDLLLVKMDATENDAPVPVHSYPTITLYKKEMWPKTKERSNMVRYQSRRKDEKVIEFIRKQCGYPMEEDKQEMVSMKVGSDGKQEVIEEEESEPFEYD